MRGALALLLLAMWAGAALLTAAAVAPAAFAVLPTRALAGALVGRVLPVVFWSGIVVGLVAAGLAWADRPAPHALGRAVAALGVVVGCGVAQLVVYPKIDRLRAAIGPSIEALALDDPQRVAFGKLHGISVAWMGAAMLSALVAVVLSVLSARRP